MRSMKTGTTIAILAAFLATFIAVDGARADGSHHDASPKYHLESACNNWARINYSVATCLSINKPKWNLTPPGYKHSVKNECSTYGTVIAHLDNVNYADHHWELDDGLEQTVKGLAWKARKISCCIDDSDLCWKDEVEKHTSGEHAGKIRIIRVLSGSYEVGYNSVETHEQRYNLCGDPSWSHLIYCKVDPEGDAHTLPASMQLDPNTASMRDLRARSCGGEGEPGCSCGGHICDRFDCEWHFNRSPATDESIGGNCWISSMTIDEASRRCTYRGRCNHYNTMLDHQTGGWHSPWQHATYTDYVWNMDDVNMCWFTENLVIQMATTWNTGDLACKGD